MGADLSRPFCYYVSQANVDEHGAFRPSIVVQNDPCHWPLNYTWGKDWKIAEKCCNEKNASMGLSEMDAWKIVASSMGAQRELRTVRHVAARKVPGFMGSPVPEIQAVVEKRLRR